MNEQEHIRMVKEGFDRLNSGDLQGTSSTWHDNIRIRTPGIPGEIDGSAYRMVLQGFYTAFPDLQFALQDFIADGKKVAVTWTATGTHTGPLMLPTGTIIEATNNRGETLGTTVYDFQDGKVSRLDSYWDMTGLLMQLGVMQSQASG